jgi:hypothetical protein
MVNISYDDAMELRKIAKTLHSLDEHACNGYHSERAEKVAGTKEKKLMARAEAIAQKYGVHAFHQGDPRGASLYLVDDLEAASSNYSSQGTCIYTR